MPSSTPMPFIVAIGLLFSGSLASCWASSAPATELRAEHPDDPEIAAPELVAVIGEDSTFAVQTSFQGGLLSKILAEDGRSAHYELTLNGVSNMTAITNSHWDSQDAVSYTTNHMIGNRLPRFALLWVTRLDHADSVMDYEDANLIISKSSVVPLTLLELVQYDEAANALRYKVELNDDVLLPENNGTSCDASSIVEVGKPFDFARASMLIDMVGGAVGDSVIIPDEAANKTSLRHAMDTGAISDVFMHNVRAAQGLQVKAQGVATLWIPFYGIGTLLFCCTSVPVITCFGACWYNPVMWALYVCCLI